MAIDLSQPTDAPRVDMSREGGMAMKRQSPTLILIGCFAATAVFAYAPVSAQQISTAQTTPSGESLPRNDIFTPKFQKRFVHMTKRYKLTPEQQRQLKSILLKEQQDRQTVTADVYMSSGNKRNELAELHEASQQKIGSILDKKQKHKFDSDEKTRAWMDGRLPEPNPGPPLGLH
jgi:Spy/CpxP family protein refolding chaperone